MDILDYIKKRGGYATLKELKSAAFQTRDISRLIKEGSIEKIKPGLYRLPEFSFGVKFRGSLIDICRAIPDGVICLTSALEFHDLTTFNPTEVFVAIPHASKPPQISYPPVRTFYFRERFYVPGIQTERTKTGTIKVYNREKTICDMFRYRNKLGEDLPIEGLKNYLRSRDANLTLLQKYAVQCQVKTVMIPYLRALTG